MGLKKYIEGAAIGFIGFVMACVVSGTHLPEIAALASSAVGMMGFGQTNSYQKKDELRRKLKKHLTMVEQPDGTWKKGFYGANDEWIDL